MIKNKKQKITQEMMRDARSSGSYGDIWTSTGKCVFCDLKDKYILYEENGVALTINLYPYIDGHLMIIPRQHITSPKELSQEQWETVRKYMYISKKIIRKVHGVKRVWHVLREGRIDAQMTVPDHLHIHVIPFPYKEFCKWDYQKLNNTPLENVQKYKDVAKTFMKSKDKFEDKYSSKQMLPVDTTLFMVNKDKKVLFIKRKEECKLDPDILTPVGGHLDDASVGLMENLKREVKEETNYDLDTSKVRLLDSQINTISYQTKHAFTREKVSRKHTFLWNTYVLTEFDESQELKAGDDAEELVWLSLDEVYKRDDVSKEARGFVERILK